MNNIFTSKIKKTHALVWLFLGMLAYKFSMDLGYVYLSGLDSKTYPLSFNPLKYAAGLVWCVVFFLNVRHTERKASSFCLYFTFLFQIVPISSIYALKNESSIYYHTLCISFFLCELTVACIEERPLFRRNLIISHTMTLCFAVAATLVIIYIILKNGAPNLSLLNIYSVYDYRNSGAFKISKYMSYLMSWTMKVFLPCGMAWAISKKKYLWASFLGSLLLLLYLYSGYKSYLFAIPFVLVGTLWARRKNCYQELFLTGCAGFSVFTVLSYFSRPGSFWYHAFSILIRRPMFLPARLKFDYYDYFSNHPKMGLYAVFPRWILPISSFYENVDCHHEISAIYYNAPEANANTGFFAEGYMRFGHIGTILLLLLFALLLKQIDRLQDRVGYQLAIGFFLYPIFELIDSHLLDTLILGAWMFLAAILLFYTLNPSQLLSSLKEVPREHPSKLPGPL